MTDSKSAKPLNTEPVLEIVLAMVEELESTARNIQRQGERFKATGDTDLLPEILQAFVTLPDRVRLDLLLTRALREQARATQ